MSPPGPSLRRLGATWVSIGWQSFGGGATTFILIERSFVRQLQWMTREEYTRDLALAQLSPGINLLGMTVLIGRRFGGTLGILVSLAGLLLPSVSITVLITALYAHVAHRLVVRHALLGIIPATVGLGMVTAIGLAASQLRHRDGRVVNTAILVGSAALAVRSHWPVVLILVCAGLVGAADSLWRRRR